MFAALYRSYACAFSLALAAALAFNACSDSPAGPTPASLKITAIAPATGSTTGGTQVTVTGTEFGPDTTLTVGGVTASNVQIQGTTALTATIGAHPAPGVVDVIVASAAKTANLTRGFTFVAPTTANQPPVTTGIRAVGPRPNQPPGFANIDDSVTLIPSVSNNESTTFQYAWTGSGSFSPSASDGTTTWRVPASVLPSPQTMTATLSVSETFVEGGVSHTQFAAPFGFQMQVHDSQKEVMDMGEDFLTLFTRQLSPDQVLHNFSRTCDGGRGRSNEEDDIEKNNDEVIEDVAAFRISRRPAFSINFRSFCAVESKPPQSNVDACSSFSVHWEGTNRANKQRFVVNGIDYVSAVLENNQWKLCHSTFIGTENYPALGITRAVAW